LKRRCLLVLAFALPHAALACGRLDAGQVLRGRFVQTRQLQGFARPLVTEGQFVLSPGRGLIWRAESPFAVTTVISPAGLRQEMHGTETFRLPAERVPFLGRLYGMLGGALSGDWSALNSDFAVTRTGDAMSWQATLTPRAAPSAMMPFQTITARGGCFVEAVDLLKPGGDTDRLRFRDQSVITGILTAEEEATLAQLIR
jgi:Outer membrane lipoprotein carrier protein LolA-like